MGEMDGMEFIEVVLIRIFNVYVFWGCFWDPIENIFTLKFTVEVYFLPKTFQNDFSRNGGRMF